MIKYECDYCHKNVESSNMVKVALRIRGGAKKIDDNFFFGKEIVKECCRECAIRVIGEATIDKIVAERIERRKLIDEIENNQEQKDD